MLWLKQRKPAPSGLYNKDSLGLGTGGPQIGGASNVTPAAFTSLRSFSSAPLPVLPILSCGLKITVLIKGLDAERSGVGRRGRETETERVEEGMDFPQGPRTVSLKTSGRPIYLFYWPPLP